MCLSSPNSLILSLDCLNSNESNLIYYLGTLSLNTLIFEVSFYLTKMPLLEHTPYASVKHLRSHSLDYNSLRISSISLLFILTY
jgi:hypothetical protein